jgi:hypothetical protein
VYGWDTLVLLKHYLESGLSKTAIARQLGVSRRAIYHWSQTGQLDRELSGTPVARQRASRGRWSRWRTWRSCVGLPVPVKSPERLAVSGSPPP